MGITEARMSHLVRWDAKKGASFVHALRLDFDRETTSRLGHAYGIIVADVPSRQGDALAAHLEDAFVRGAAEAVRKLSGDAPQDQLFEAAIARTNHALNRLFGEHGLGIEPERISAAIVSLKGHDLVAATWGSPSMLLFHPMPSGASRIFDMVDDSSAEPQQYRTANVRRCFGSIIAGRMGKRDRLLIASQDLRHFLGEEALTASIIDHEPDEATAVLNRILSPRDESVSVALMVLDVAEIRYVESDPTVVTAKRNSVTKTNASIAKLLQTASETGETLAPSLMGGITKKVSGLLRRTKEEELEVEDEYVDEEPAALPEPKPLPRAAVSLPQRQELLAQQPVAHVPELPASLRMNAQAASDATPAAYAAPVAQQPQAYDEPADAYDAYDANDYRDDDDDVRTMPTHLAPQMPANAQRHEDGDKTILATAFTMIGALLVGLAKLSFRLLRGLGSFLLAMFSAESRKAKFQQLREDANNAVATRVDQFNNLSKPSKALLLAALLLALVAKGGIMAAAKNKAKEDVIAQYEQTLSGIQQKIDSAEASAIYHDESRANTLLTEALAAIDALPEGTPDEQAKKAEFRKQIAVTRGSLRREVQLGAPAILASIATMNGNATLAKMTATTDSLWLASDDGQVFRVPANGGTAEKAGDVAGGTAPAVLIPDGKDVYAAPADGKGVYFTASGKTIESAVDFKDGETVPTAADLYSGRLYVLDTAHNRISRHLEKTNGFDAPQFYLKDGTDLAGSVSLAIDGVVWVLKSDGTIMQIEQGLRKNFTAAQADPPVSSAVRLRTNGDSDLFVLDSSPARILRFDKKSGSLVAQFVSPELQGATDFAIDAKGQTAFVTKGNQVLKFALPAP